MQNFSLLDSLKKIGKHGIPAVMSTIGIIIYSLTDRYFISNYCSEKSLAIFSLSLPVYNIFLAFGLMIGIGVTTHISISHSKNRKKKSNIFFTEALFLTIICSLIITIVMGLNVNKIISFLSNGKIVDPVATKSFLLLLYFSLFFIFNTAYTNILRADNKKYIAMFITLLGTIVNLILDYVFINILAIGLIGAIYATIIGNILTSILFGYFLFFKKSNFIFNVRYIFKINYIKKIIITGLAPFINQITAAIIIIITNKSLSVVAGNTGLAIFAIINSLVIVVRLPIISLMQGLQALIGHEYGSNNHKSLFNSLKALIMIAIIVGSLFLIITSFFNVFIIDIFGLKGGNELAKNAIKIFFSGSLIMCINTITAYYFIAINKPKISNIINILQQIILIPSFLIFLPKFLGIDGIWIATPLGESFTFIVSLYFIIKELKYLKALNPNIN